MKTFEEWYKSFLDMRNGYEPCLKEAYDSALAEAHAEISDLKQRLQTTENSLGYDQGDYLQDAERAKRELKKVRAELDAAVQAEREELARRLDTSYACYSPSPVADAFRGHSEELRARPANALEVVKLRSRIQGRKELQSRILRVVPGGADVVCKSHIIDFQERCKECAAVQRTLELESALCEAEKGEHDVPK